MIFRRKLFHCAFLLEALFSWKILFLSAIRIRGVYAFLGTHLDVHGIDYVYSAFRDAKAVICVSLRLVASPFTRGDCTRNLNEEPDSRTNDTQNYTG